VLLPDINFDLELKPEEYASGQRFPPARFQERDERLAVLSQIRQGDFSEFVEDEDLVRIPVGLPRRLVNVQADVLLMSDVEAPYPLRETAADGIRDMLAYGGAIITAYNPGSGPENAVIATIDPANWYPVDGGGDVLIRPWTSPNADSNRPDRVEITELIGGKVTVRNFEWTGHGGVYGHIGDPVGESQELGDGGIVVSPRAPTSGIWGESIYADTLGPLFEITKRVTQNSDILDRNAKPVPYYSSSTVDAQSLFPLDSDADDQSELAKWEEANKGFAELKGDSDALVLNDQTQQVGYLEFTGNLVASFEQIKTAREILSVLSGLPALLGDGDAIPPSGISLRLQYLPFYAATLALQKDLTEKLTMALALAGVGGQVVWRHIFEVLDGEAEARAAAMQSRLLGLDEEGEEEIDD